MFLGMNFYVQLVTLAGLIILLTRILEKHEM